MNNQPNTFTITDALASALRQFIGGCPFDQVRQLVADFDGQLMPQAAARVQAPAQPAQAAQPAE